jgi:hypothetical protein
METVTIYPTCLLYSLERTVRNLLIFVRHMWQKLRPVSRDLWIRLLTISAAGQRLRLAGWPRSWQCCYSYRKKPKNQQYTIRYRYRHLRDVDIGYTTYNSRQEQKNDKLCIYFFFISKFILKSVVIHLAELCVRLQWLGERHSVEPLRE